ncbi:MAG: hypothetical protein LUE12_02665 [Ruminococcus sp.]|nr:hypothetical protein [Ruminococcus sp.]
MKKVPQGLLYYLDKNIINRIIDKYNMSQMEATIAFLSSKTHDLLEDAQYTLIQFTDEEIFGAWEVEQITGNPRNYIYLRSD